LDELQGLLKEQYITEAEYAAARANVLLEAGVNIARRSRAAGPRRVRQLEARSRRTAAAPDHDYKRVLIPFLLIAGMVSCAAFLVWMLTGGELTLPFIGELLPGVLTPSVSTPRVSAPSVSTPGVSTPGLLTPPSVELNEFVALIQSGSFDEGSFDEKESASAEGGTSVFSAESEAPEPPAVSEDHRPDGGAAKEETGETGETEENEEGTSSLSGVPAEEPEEPEEKDSGEKAGLGWGVVSVRRVRIRAAPDTSANNVLGWASSGERFAILKEANGRDGSKWYNVRYEKNEKTGKEGGVKTEGWIKASMMKRR
jgi:hypothetical protein